jgi:nicotinamide-nucleotide amidase
MQAEVINTGSELLLGLVTNTHLAFLAGELQPCGIAVARQVCVPDGPPIRQALERALERAEIVIATGGLGPTSDDITREAAAELLGCPLEEDAGILATITRRFARRGLPMAARVARQAMVPRGAVVLPNPHGTAPGLYFPPETLGPRRGRHLFLLPGPPRELRPMVRDHVLPRLRDVVPGTGRRTQRIYRLTGIGESQVEELVGRSIEERGTVEVGYCARPSEVDLRLIGAPSDLAAADDQVRAAVGEWIYSDGATLEEVVIALLRERRLTLAVAESCTGGDLAGRLTDVPGASAAFLCGFVTYANAAKEQALSVPSALLAAHGAVSAEVAGAMAAGALAAGESDFALSTTGIAGPDGGSEEKPVGTLFLGLADRNGPPVVRRCFFPADRPVFKNLATAAALDFLRRRILGLPLEPGGGSAIPKLG